MGQHTGGNWKFGKPGDSIVTDVPIEGTPMGADAVDYYGGYLIAESVAPCNRPLLAAAKDMYECLEWFMLRAGFTDSDDSGPFGLLITDVEGRKIRDRFRAVLRKARGEEGAS